MDRPSHQLRGRCRSNDRQRAAGALSESAHVYAAQVRDAIGSFVEAGLADTDDVSHLLVLHSGEMFRLDDDSITRLL